MLLGIEGKNPTQNWKQSDRYRKLVGYLLI